MTRFYESQTRFTLVLILSMLLGACGLDNGAKSDVDKEVNHVEGNGAKSADDKMPLSSTKENAHIYLGTGSVQGVYFPIGGVICRLLNRKTYVHRIRCTLESTGGSIYNLRQLRENNFDVVFAQSDWQYNAYYGKSTFEKEKPNPDLRAVFALEADPLALIVQQDSDISEFNDLKGRVVSFGYARALQHRIIGDLLEVKGWTDKTFKSVRTMSDNKQVSELCNSKVDAILLLSSSLNDRLSDLDESCKLKIVPITGSEIDKVIEQKPYYRKSVIAKGDYLDSSKDINSFGLGATFVALESTSPKAVYHVVKEVVENFNDFKSLHPSLKRLNKRELPYAGISIPLHSGAIRYYKEAGLLK